jgi:hypothetical protein
VAEDLIAAEIARRAADGIGRRARGVETRPARHGPPRPDPVGVNPGPRSGGISPRSQEGSISKLPERPCSSAHDAVVCANSLITSPSVLPDLFSM